MFIPDWLIFILAHLRGIAAALGVLACIVVALIIWRAWK